MNHKWYKEIIAYANGENLQFRIPSVENNWTDFTNEYASPNFNDTDVEFRIKPKPREFKYIIGLFKNCEKPCIISIDNTSILRNFENSENFIRWLTHVQTLEYDEE